MSESAAGLQREIEEASRQVAALESASAAAAAHVAVAVQAMDGILAGKAAASLELHSLLLAAPQPETAAATAREGAVVARREVALHRRLEEASKLSEQQRARVQVAKLSLSDACSRAADAERRKAGLAVQLGDLVEMQPRMVALQQVGAAATALHGNGHFTVRCVWSCMPLALLTAYQRLALCMLYNGTLLRPGAVQLDEDQLVESIGTFMQRLGGRPSDGGGGGIFSGSLQEIRPELWQEIVPPRNRVVQCFLTRHKARDTEQGKKRFEVYVQGAVEQGSARNYPPMPEPERAGQPRGGGLHRADEWTAAHVLSAVKHTVKIKTHGSEYLVGAPDGRHSGQYLVGSCPSCLSPPAPAASVHLHFFRQL